MIVDCLFPGGNILVEKIDGSDLYLRQDQRDTLEPWFYWYFRLRGAAGQTVRVHFTAWNVIGARGPAVSLDEGRTWQWAGAGGASDAGFEFPVPAGCAEIRFAYTIPYLEADLAGFMAKHAGHPQLEINVLCASRKGRPVELLHLGTLHSLPRHKLLLTARHHACESMASFVLEGMLDTFLGGGPTGRWFQHSVECWVVPFMDKDGVEDGDQGKARAPKDHNRDYAGESIYAEVRALRRLAPDWAGVAGIDFALDLHCPWIRGGRNEEIFFVGCADRVVWETIGTFCDALERIQRGPLPYARKNNLEYGQEWNVAPPADQKMADQWWREMGWNGTTIEIPYANAGGAEVTPVSARLLGKDLAEALHSVLE